MSNQIKKWNQSHSEIPVNKSVSTYAVTREKEFPRNSLVCDLGGGTGADSIHFLQQGHEVILVDISDFALNEAIKKANALGLTIKTHRTTLGQELIPLGDSAVDVIYSRLALHYFDRLTTVEVFRDIYRVLKIGGKAFITVKSPEDTSEMHFLKSTATEKETGVFEDNGDIKSRFTKEQLDGIIKEAGITSFEVRSYEEDLGGRIDKVKSGNKQLLLNEIRILK